MFDYLRNKIIRERYTPSRREMAEDFGINVRAVQKHLEELERFGFIFIHEYQARRIEIIKEPAKHLYTYRGMITA